MSSLKENPDCFLNDGPLIDKLLIPVSKNLLYSSTVAKQSPV